MSASSIDMRASTVVRRTCTVRTIRAAFPPPPSSGPRLSSTQVVTTTQAEGESHLHIEGAFDASTVGEIQVAIESVVATQPHHVAIDLARVSTLDSFGVRAIVSLWRRVVSFGGSVALLHVHGQPLTVVKLFKLDELLASRPVTAA